MTKKSAKGVRELRDIDVGEISLVDKPAIRREFIVVKRDASEDISEMKTKSTKDEASKAPDEEAEKSAATPDEETDAEKQAPAVEPEVDAGAEKVEPGAEGEGGEMAEGEGEGDPALIAAIEVGLPALVQWVESLEDGDVKAALMLLTESVANLGKAAPGAGAEGDEEPDDEKEDAEKADPLAKAFSDFQSAIGAILKAGAVGAPDEKEDEKETEKKAPTTKSVAPDNAVKEILSKVGDALSAVTKSNEAISKRLDAIEKVRPVAKSEGSGEQTAVAKGNTTDALFSKMFGQ